MKLLPAPPGEPQPIHLPDGSMLVPLARVNADGSRTPLRAGGAASAPLAPATAPVSTMTAPAPAAPSTPASSSSQTTGGGGANFEPKGFLYNDRYFKKFANAGGIAVSDVKAVEERVTRATFAYLLEEEPEVDDYGVTNIRMRRADPARDADLIAINPRAHWIVDVDGVQGNGQPKSIPSVVNSDGAVFVDPRITRG